MKQFVLTSIMKMIPLAVEGAKRIVSSIRVLNARPELRLRAGLKTEQYKKPVEIACLLHWTAQDGFRFQFKLV
jgi:hypothetical protein